MTPDLPKSVQSIHDLAKQHGWAVAVQWSSTEAKMIALTFGRTIDGFTWRAWAVWMLDDGVKFGTASSLAIPPGPLKTLARLKAFLADPASVPPQSEYVPTPRAVKEEVSA